MSKEILEKLKAPFREEEIEWRIQSCGEKNGKIWAIVLAYVSARAIMDRLDEVLGIGGWQVNYEFVKGDEKTTPGVLCHLLVKIDRDWMTKTDGAEQTDMESFKGGISSAFKRAAVLYGVGRYLYGLEATFAQITEDKEDYSGKTKEGKWFHWRAPKLPNWALPGPAVASGPDRTSGSLSGQGLDNDRSSQETPGSELKKKIIVPSPVGKAPNQGSSGPLAVSRPAILPSETGFSDPSKSLVPRTFETYDEAFKYQIPFKGEWFGKLLGEVPDHVRTKMKAWVVMAPQKTQGMMDFLEACVIMENYNQK